MRMNMIMNAEFIDHRSRYAELSVEMESAILCAPRLDYDRIRQVNVRSEHFL